MPTNTINNAANSSATGNATSDVTRDRMQDLGVEQFLKLLIAELQNQDPLNPMDNAQMIQQVSEIRSIVASDKLTDTLSGVQLGQAIASASSMLGKTVNGISDASQDTEGVVERVTVVDGVPKLHVGGQQIDLKNIREILPQESNDAWPYGYEFLNDE
jgi:flagellar basal-body rod modification protein FlgD